MRTHLSNDCLSKERVVICVVHRDVEVLVGESFDGGLDHLSRTRREGGEMVERGIYVRRVVRIEVW